MFNNKLTYKLEYEYKILPDQINILEKKINKAKEILSNPNLYVDNYDKFLKYSKILEMSKKDLDKLETRWLELDLIKNSL